MTGSFNGSSQDALMLSTGSGLSTGADLSLFSDQAAQNIRLFVVNGQMLISTELADFWAGIVPAFSALIHVIFISRFTFHKKFHSNLLWVAASITAT
jgi:hypothetical protein